jgi:hypothetical protein
MRRSHPPSAAVWIAAWAFAGSAAADELPMAHHAFQSFASDWVKQMAADADRQRAALLGIRPPSSRTAPDGTYRVVSPDYSIQLKETGDKAAPFVGILTYIESVYQCEGASLTNCRLVQTEPITEIFPFKDGRWQY